MQVRGRIKFAVVAAMGLLLTACAQVSGGGFLPSAGDPEAKASFGFDLTCNENGYLVGSWVYHDKTPGQGLEAPVRVTGTITEAVAEESSLTCDGSNADKGGEAYIESPFTTQGKDSTTGTAQIIAFDGNQGGNASMKGDKLGIALMDESWNRWYTNGEYGYWHYDEGFGGSIMGPTPVPTQGGNLTVTGGEPLYGGD